MNENTVRGAAYLNAMAEKMYAEENVPSARNFRAEVLKEAIEIVMSDRQMDYGTPEDNFGMIANLWSIYFDIGIRPDQVAGAMILLKLARSTNASKKDNAVDIAGYAACMFEVDPRK